MEPSITSINDIINGTVVSTAFPLIKHDMGVRSPTTRILIEVGLATMSAVGIGGNFAAMYTLSSSTQIKTSRSYILLMNQSLIDGIFNMLSVMSIGTRYVLPKSNMSGTIDWMICNFLHSQVIMAAPSVSSSYNLSMLTIERMISVVFPIFHRVKLTDGVMKKIAVFMWITGLLVMLPMSIPSNNIAPDGTCFFWNGLSPELQVFVALATNILLTIVPFFMMVVAFSIMYFRILVMGLQVRMNVIRTLGTCVLLFFLCHFLQAMFSMLTRIVPNGKNWYAEPVYMFAQLLMQVNSIVNPFVYLIQYTEYRNELSYQVRRIVGKATGKVVPERDAKSSSVGSVA